MYCAINISCSGSNEGNLSFGQAALTLIFACLGPLLAHPSLMNILVRGRLAWTLNHWASNLYCTIGQKALAIFNVHKLLTSGLKIEKFTNYKDQLTKGTIFYILNSEVNDNQLAILFYIYTI